MENVLWSNFSKSQSENDREKLIKFYLPFAKKVALLMYKIWQESEIQSEDFIQYATVGLIEAVDSYDSQIGTSFRYYAKFRIRGAILNAISRYSENLDCQSYRRTIELERRKSVMKIIDSGKESAFDKFYQLVINYAVIHILDDEESYNLELAKNSPYQQPVEYTIKQQLVELLEYLPDRSKVVLKLHYLEDMSFTEIARYLKLSKASISVAHGEGIQLVKNLYKSSELLNKKG